MKIGQTHQAIRKLRFISLMTLTISMGFYRPFFWMAEKQQRTLDPRFGTCARTEYQWYDLYFAFFRYFCLSAVNRCLMYTRLFYDFIIRNTFALLLAK